MGRYILRDKAIEIVKQEAEKFGTDTNVGSNGWIPVSERLPCVRDGNVQELVPPEDCKKCMMEWLQSEVEE